MKKLTTLFAVVLLATAATSSALASVMSFRLSIDGDPNMLQLPLAPGVHTLVVEAIVTDNDIIPDTPGGVLQSSFNLSTDNDGFTFVDDTGGFLGAPNGTWDSTTLIPPFDTHFQGSTTLNGGPVVSEETHAMSPGNFNTKFQDVGANVYSVVATGDFVYDPNDIHPSHLDLTSSLSIVLVAGFDGVAQVLAVAPDVVENASIWFIPEPGSFVLAGMGLIGLVVGRRRRC